MAKAVGAEAQALHHLLAYAPWSVQALRTRRLTFLRQAKELQQWGFRCSVVLADSLSGESSDFISQLEQLQLKYVVAMRSHHGVWLPPGQRVRSTNWRPFERVFSNRKQHTRFFPRDRLWAARAHPLLPPHDRSPTTASREYLVHHDQSSGQIQKTVGNTSGLRPWIEYGFTHAKNELGWADFRVTDYACIERWWELVSCADLLVSLQSPVLQPASTEPASPQAARVSTPTDRFSEHRWWDSGQGWKNILNNLRLILKPYVFYCLLLPWLLLFDIPSLRAGFLQLNGIMNLFHAASQLDRRGITPCLFHTRGSSKRV